MRTGPVDGRAEDAAGTVLVRNMIGELLVKAMSVSSSVGDTAIAHFAKPRNSVMSLVETT